MTVPKETGNTIHLAENPPAILLEMPLSGALEEKFTGNLSEFPEIL
ncbi:hypothetical protein [Paenibacillus sp. sgz500992]